jgi:hypothetical protein
MNYQKIYTQLVEHRKINKHDDKTYTENHHILPRCMGGDNTKSNLVRLSAREHFIAHELLFKIHRTSAMAHAWFCMSRQSKYNQRVTNSRQFAKSKEAHINALKETMKGKGNHFYGKKHTDETKRKIGEANKGESRSPEQVAAWVENVAKKPKTKDHRKKIGRKGLVMIKNIHTNEVFRIPAAEAATYDKDVWKNPAVHQKRIKCVHCGMESVAGNIKRWHNDNCKSNPITL